MQKTGGSSRFLGQENDKLIRVFQEGNLVIFIKITEGGGS